MVRCSYDSKILSIFFYYIAPDGAPVNVVTVAVTSTTVTLSWDPPDDELHNGVIRHYLIFVYEVNTGSNTTLQTSHTTFSIGDLHPFYSYQVGIRAVTMLPGPTSSLITFSTQQDGNLLCL